MRARAARETDMRSAMARTLTGPRAGGPRGPHAGARHLSSDQRRFGSEDSDGRGGRRHERDPTPNGARDSQPHPRREENLRARKARRGAGGPPPGERVRAKARTAGARTRPKGGFEEKGTEPNSSQPRPPVAALRGRGTEGLERGPAKRVQTRERGEGRGRRNASPRS